jgi:hypothetical protein
MTEVTAAFLSLALVFCCRNAAATAAPPQLYGKSIIVSWTYNFMLRRAGSQAPFHPQSFQHRMSIYVSSAGRPFVRHAATSPGGSGASERVGTGGLSYGGGPRNVQFQGSSLVLHTLQQSQSYATQIKIDFDPGFANCRASAIFGRGAGVSTFKSISTGEMIEAQSALASDVSCSIKDGNVFAE